MTRTSRIDDLRASFALNPRRYFAPLANEYRRTGALVEAIALCASYLPKFPGHMSGHIVYGQTLFDAGRRDEARTVFEQAIALDPENLIALRYLGDIAWALGDAATARRWYERVLEADPRNDDIAAQLATIGASGRSVAGRPAVAEPIAATGGSAPVSTEAVPASWKPAAPESAPVGGSWETPEEADGWFPIPAGATLPDPDPFAFPDLPGGVIAGSAEAADWLESVHAAATEPEDPSLAPVPFEEGLVAPVWTDSAALIERPMERTAPSASTTTAGHSPVAGIGGNPAEVAAVFGAERSDAVVPRPAPVEAGDPEPYFAETQAPAPLRVPTPVIVAPVAAAPADEPTVPLATATATATVVSDEPALEEITRLFQEDARAAGEADAIRLETRAIPRTAPMAEGGITHPEAPAAFVTETMAELLVAQGLLDRGIAIYEELVRQRPSEPWLAERLAAVRAMEAAQSPSAATRTEAPARVPTARQWWSTLASRAPAAAAPMGTRPAFTAPSPALASAPARRSPPYTSADRSAAGLAELFGDPDRSLPPDDFAAAFTDVNPMGAASRTATTGTVTGGAVGGAFATATRGPLAEPGRLTPAAATDLAHFSAWLKDAAT